MSSGPWTMSVRMQSWQLASNSVMLPPGVIRPILAGAPVNSVPSVNQTLPSEPLVIARGSLLAVGTLNCFSAPTGAASAALPIDKTRTTATAVDITRPALRDIVLPRYWPHRRRNPRTPAASRSQATTYGAKAPAVHT